MCTSRLDLKSPVVFYYYYYYYYYYYFIIITIIIIIFRAVYLLSNSASILENHEAFDFLVLFNLVRYTDS